MAEGLGQVVPRASRAIRPLSGSTESRYDVRVGHHAILPEPLLVERQEQIDALVAAARAEGRFAFDTEFVMEDRYEAEVCLVQLATQESVLLVDPFQKLDLDAIWDLVCDAGVETVVHAGGEDLAVCVRKTGRPPRAIFDVQVAAGLVGFDYPLSLQKLVESTMHVRLHKAKTLTDWRKRPLSGSQLRYAAEDVSYLLAVRGKLHDRLIKRDRVAWVQEEFRGLEDIALYARVEEDRLRRVKGVSVLRGQQLAVARELLRWRDELAQKLDRPARVVMKDYLLVEIARHGWTAHAELRDLRGLNMSDKNLHALAGVVGEAMAAPPEDWPAARPHEVEAPREAVLSALATAVVRGYCLDHDIAYGLAATKRSIGELIRHRTVGVPADAKQVELLSGWRGQSVGRLLDDVLAGRRTIRVEPVQDEWVVRVGPLETPP